jgi:hypothetical protein
MCFNLLELANESRIGSTLPTKKIYVSLYSSKLGLIGYSAYSRDGTIRPFLQSHFHC